MAVVEENYVGFGISSLTGKPHTIRHLPKDVSWEQGIYQFEMGDKVIGGVDGVDNLPNQQLANRTEWLFASIQYLAWKFADNLKKFLMASSGEIQQILNGVYQPSGSTGEGEANGVATSSQVQAILNGSYTATADDGIEEYAIGDIPNSAEIQAILSGSYIHIDKGDNPVSPPSPSDDSTSESVEDDFGDTATEDDISDIMSAYDWDD